MSELWDFGVQQCGSACHHEIAAADSDSLEPQYENVGGTTQPDANSSAARLNSGKLLKKPKPGPKPNYVAVKVAELNARQKMSDSDGTMSRLSQTKSSQLGSLSVPAHRPTTAVSAATTITICDAGQSLTGDDGDELYDSAVTVDVDALRRITHTHNDPADDVSTTFTLTSRRPADDRASEDQQETEADEEEERDRERDEESDGEPVYDEAIAVVCGGDEPVYEEAISVDTDRLMYHDDDDDEPLYAEPDDIILPAAGADLCHWDEDNFLYEEALPVNNLTAPATTTNCLGLPAKF